jgi:hypothetical protein
MKRLFVITVISFVAACNPKEAEKKEEAKTEPTAPMINSPYEVTYSSKFVMGDPKNAEAVLTLWKDWDNGTLAAHKDFIADTMQIYFSDGSSMKASRDSIIASVQAFRNTYASSASQVHAVMAVKSTDKNENWALIWGMEKNTDKKGKVDSTDLQETWRFNKDGKADLMYQFRAQIPPPPKK